MSRCGDRSLVCSEKEWGESEVSHAAGDLNGGRCIVDEAQIPALEISAGTHPDRRRAHPLRRLRRKCNRGRMMFCTCQVDQTARPYLPFNRRLP
jgi:hypothetical protein